MNTKFLAVFFCLYTIAARAVIVSGSRWSINGKTLILLGDYHQRTMHDNQQINLIEKYLKRKGVQCFFEGLPAERVKYFDVYKKSRATLFGQSEDKKSFNLNTESFLYYDKILQQAEDSQSQLLKKIADYSLEELQKNNNLVPFFLDDFKKINQAYHLHSLLSFFDKKYCLGYLNRHVVDVRLTFELLVNEVAEQNLNIIVLKAYLKKSFSQKDRKYSSLLKKLEKKGMSENNNQFNKLYEWYKKECTDICLNISVYLKILEGDTVIYNMSTYFEDALKSLFNFDCMVYLLNALFFEKNKIVMGVFGSDHTAWMEQVLAITGFTPTMQYKTVENTHYQPSLWHRTALAVDENTLDENLVADFIKDTKQKLIRDPERTYYYDDSSIFSVPLAINQLSNLLYVSLLKPSILNIKASQPIEKLQKHEGLSLKIKKKK